MCREWYENHGVSSGIYFQVEESFPLHSGDSITCSNTRVSCTAEEEQNFASSDASHRTARKRRAAALRFVRLHAPRMVSALALRHITSLVPQRPTPAGRLQPPALLLHVPPPAQRQSLRMLSWCLEC